MMSSYSGQLLCTFSTLREYEADIFSLPKFYKIEGGRIYILSNTENGNEVFLTFNGIKLGEECFHRTISVHRKKDYNVLYSINALNELVKLENNGQNSSNFNISWDQYQNSLITIKDSKLKVSPTKLIKIFWLY